MQQNQQRKTIFPHSEDQETNIGDVDMLNMIPKLIYFRLESCPFCEQIDRIWANLEEHKQLQDKILLEKITIGQQRNTGQIIPIPDEYKFVRFTPFVYLEAGNTKTNPEILATSAGIVLGKNSLISVQSLIESVNHHLNVCRFFKTK